SYRVAKVSDDLLQFTAFGSSDRAAIRWADALGAALLNFRADELARQAEAATRALEERAASLRTELETIARGITDASGVAGPTTPAPAAGTALSDLLTRSAAAHQRLAGIQSQLDDRTLGLQAVVDNSHVLDPATSNPLPGRKALVTNLLSGIIAGVALGMGIVIVQEVFRDRVRKRSDVMAAT